MADCSTLWARGRRSCAGWPTQLAHRRLHSWQVDTSSRRRLQSRTSLNFLHRHAEFFQIWRCDAVDAFSYEDRSLENDRLPHCSASGGCVGLDWCDPHVVILTIDEPQKTILWGFRKQINRRKKVRFENVLRFHLSILRKVHLCWLQWSMWECQCNEIRARCTTGHLDAACVIINVHQRDRPNSRVMMLIDASFNSTY